MCVKPKLQQGPKSWENNLAHPKAKAQKYAVLRQTLISLLTFSHYFFFPSPSPACKTVNEFKKEVDGGKRGELVANGHHVFINGGSMSSLDSDFVVFPLIPVISVKESQDGRL